MAIVQQSKDLVARRPAETAAPVAAALAYLFSRLFNWDAEVTSALTVVLSFIPAGVSYIVDHARKP